MAHTHGPPADDARLAFAIAAALLVAAAAERFAADEGPRPPRAFERHLVDLNAAPAGEIEALPGVGPVLASRIVAARGDREFTSAGDLGRVPGVGPATIERLRAFVRCGAR